MLHSITTTLYIEQQTDKGSAVNGQIFPGYIPSVWCQHLDIYIKRLLLIIITTYTNTDTHTHQNMDMKHYVIVPMGIKLCLCVWVCIYNSSYKLQYWDLTEKYDYCCLSQNAFVWLYAHSKLHTRYALVLFVSSTIVVVCEK